MKTLKKIALMFGIIIACIAWNTAMAQTHLAKKESKAALKEYKIEQKSNTKFKSKRDKVKQKDYPVAKYKAREKSMRKHSKTRTG